MGSERDSRSTKIGLGRRVHTLVLDDGVNTEALDYLGKGCNCADKLSARNWRAASSRISLKFRATAISDNCSRKEVTTPNLVAMALVKADSDYIIKPQASAPAIDTSDWPLLLKNYNDRMQLHS